MITRYKRFVGCFCIGIISFLARGGLARAELGFMTGGVRHVKHTPSALALSHACTARARAGPMKATVLWSKEDPFGTELSEVHVREGSLSAVGVSVGVFSRPGADSREAIEAYRLEYRLSTSNGFVTDRLVVNARGTGWSRAIDLRRVEGDHWHCTSFAEGNLDLPPPGGDLGHLRGALDCDLGLSPLTNSMPVLRHRLNGPGEAVELVMAWVSVPDLSVRQSLQRYRFLERSGRERLVRFETLDDPFTADLTFDDQGLITRYPGLATRVI